MSPASARVLGVPERAGTSLSLSLLTFLRSRRLLLVLDNFEQVVAAGPLVRDLVARTAGVRVLVTSRVPLRVEGEQVKLVAPLPVPTTAAIELPDVLASPALQLFVARGQAVNPGLVPDAHNAADLAAICVRLDGLPLALELAAARMNVLTPAALLARLEHSLTLLSRGERGRPARQQTLRAALLWSWDLLDDAERRLFRRLAVFAGGWTFEGAAAVCSRDGEPDVFDDLASLVDRNLVRRQDDSSGEPRFQMLATVREFALEQLGASGESTDLRHRHAEYFCRVADAAFVEVGNVDRTRRCSCSSASATICSQRCAGCCSPARWCSVSGWPVPCIRTGMPGNLARG